MPNRTLASALKSGQYQNTSSLSAAGHMRDMLTYEYLANRHKFVCMCKTYNQCFSNGLPCAKNTVTIERTRWGLVPSMRAHRCHRLTARACAALPFPFSSSFTPSKWPIRYVNSTIFTPKRPEICETAVPDDAKTLVNTRCE